METRNCTELAINHIIFGDLLTEQSRRRGWQPSVRRRRLASVVPKRRDCGAIHPRIGAYSAYAMSSYSPSPSSLALRASVAQALSGLRRTKPRVPFWALAAHRVPTLWTLYRGLLRASPGENVSSPLIRLFTTPYRTHRLDGEYEECFNVIST